MATSDRFRRGTATCALVLVPRPRASTAFGRPVHDLLAAPAVADQTTRSPSSRYATVPFARASRQAAIRRARSGESLSAASAGEQNAQPRSSSAGTVIFAATSAGTMPPIEDEHHALRPPLLRRNPVDSQKTTYRQTDAKLLLQLPAHCLVRRLVSLDSPARDFPVVLVCRLNEEYSILSVEEQRTRPHPLASRRDRVLLGRRGVVVHPPYATGRVSSAEPNDLQRRARRALVGCLENAYEKVAISLPALTGRVARAWTVHAPGTTMGRDECPRTAMTCTQRATRTRRSPSGVFEAEVAWLSGSRPARDRHGKRRIAVRGILRHGRARVQPLVIVVPLAQHGIQPTRVRR